MLKSLNRTKITNADEGVVRWGNTNQSNQMQNFLKQRKISYGSNTATINSVVFRLQLYFKSAKEVAPCTHIHILYMCIISMYYPRASVHARTHTQLTLKQYGFERLGSTYMHIFLINYLNVFSHVFVTFFSLAVF